MTEEPHVGWTAQELVHLTDEQVGQRRREAVEAEAHAEAPGMGRSVKGRRLSRRDRELVEEEMGRCGST